MKKTNIIFVSFFAFGAVLVVILAMLEVTVLPRLAQEDKFVQSASSISIVTKAKPVEEAKEEKNLIQIQPATNEFAETKKGMEPSGSAKKRTYREMEKLFRDYENTMAELEDFLKISRKNPTEDPSILQARNERARYLLEKLYSLAGFYNEFSVSSGGALFSKKEYLPEGEKVVMPAKINPPDPMVAAQRYLVTIGDWWGIENNPRKRLNPGYPLSTTPNGRVNY